MKRNYHYILSAAPANPTVDLRNYVNYFPTLISNYNCHVVCNNRKEIDNIRLSNMINNAIEIDFWSEKELPAGRELQSLRRISEGLAAIDPSVVIRKSHVLISA